MLGICLPSLALRSLAKAWTPAALWPTGTEPGMWIDPSLLTASFNDSTGTTPVATPGSVADSANPVGLALDIRAGAPATLGPELVVTANYMEAAWTHIGGQTYSAAGGVGYLVFPGTVAGKMYVIETTTIDYVAGSVVTSLNAPWDVVASANGTFTTYIVSSATGGINFYCSGFNGIVTISVREVPGNHMLQSTSAARPLMSARVNLLILKSPYPFDASDDMTDAAVVDATVVNAAGTNTITCGAAADVLVRMAKTNPISAGVTQSFPAGVPFTYSFDVVGVGGAVGKKVCFAVERVGGPNASEEITLSAVTQRVSAVMPAGASPSDIYAYIALKGFGTTANLATGDAIEITNIHLNIGSAATDYQYADTTALYDATGITPFQLYDGIDDSMATASFAAGTLINGMDCMIPVRRDSTALAAIGGLYQADQTKYFGVLGIASGDTASTYGGCGAPSVFVDNVAVANTRGALYNAIGVGDWHILEYRGLDLSAWVNAAWGAYPTYLFNGARGDILLFPSTASTADKDAARQYLADKYGVTLA